MIDFKQSMVHLSPIPAEKVRPETTGFLAPQEVIIAAFQTVRDQVVFTSKRIIATNVQGLTGKKIDYTSISYTRIHAFSIETAGTFDLDSEFEFWVSEIGKIRFAFSKGVDVLGLKKSLGSLILQ